MINSDGRVIIAPVNDVLSINLSTPIFNKAVAINIYIPSLRANDIHTKQVETIDFMTAHWAHLPYDLLGKVSNRIINEVNGISRVVYDISGKPPATIEWE